MRKSILAIFLSFLLVIGLFNTGAAQETENKYSLWIGTHYSDYQDNNKKVAEYELGKNRFFPEVRFSLLSKKNDGNLFRLAGNYFDDRNYSGKLNSYMGDRFKLEVEYKTSIKHLPYDSMNYMETREAGGGKILTHELFDGNADYKVYRTELKSKINALLSRKHNIKFTAIHKAITKTGSEQKISNTHCFSCHLTSHSAEVDQISHQVVAGLQGDIGQQTVGYEFGYRSFKSNAFNPLAWYDQAVHPVLGTSGAEFQTRVLFSNTTAAFSIYPEIEKFSHKLRAKGKALNGKYAGSIGYSMVENDISDLESKAYTGAIAYSTILSPKARLVAKLSVAKLETDEIAIDLPDFREGRPGVTTDFDYTRYSALNRMDGKGSVELTYRYKPNVTLAALVGLNIVDRDDYPYEGDGTKSNTFIGQVKAKYRKGLKYSTSIKYRYEKTSDPFFSSRGLFERWGQSELVADSVTGFIYYWQREDLRYQNITTLPTDVHIIAWSANWKPNNKVDVNFGFKGKFDKNNDLDSLDIKHSSMVPNLALNFRPQSNLSFTLGGTYNMYKSSGPVTVALFDG